MHWGIFSFANLIIPAYPAQATSATYDPFIPLMPLPWPQTTKKKKGGFQTHKFGSHFGIATRFKTTK